MRLCLLMLACWACAFYDNEVQVAAEMPDQPCKDHPSSHQAHQDVGNDHSLSGLIDPRSNAQIEVARYCKPLAVLLLAFKSGIGLHHDRLIRNTDLDKAVVASQFALPMGTLRCSRARPASLHAAREKRRPLLVQLLRTFLFRRFGWFGRRALKRYLNGTSVSWHKERSGELQRSFWACIHRVQHDSEPSACALPDLTTLELRSLVDLVEAELCGVRVSVLPMNAPVSGLLAEPRTRLHASLQPPATPKSQHAKIHDLHSLASTETRDLKTLDRMRAWVGRALSRKGLKLCPYTGSSSSSASGLEHYGIPEAPILYVNCDADTLTGLMNSFWDACVNMLEVGEKETSSIILSAPHWDARFDEWYRVVFPLLEDSVRAAGLIRELGVVCFHPEYSTPSEEWLEKHRFGPHMPTIARLRSYIEESDPQLSAATDDDALLWAGEYQRRSPHAMINVLWSRQLLLAEENGTKMSAVYTRNIGSLLRTGREQLERASSEERAM